MKQKNDGRENKSLEKSQFITQEKSSLINFAKEQFDKLVNKNLRVPVSILHL